MDLLNFESEGISKEHIGEYVFSLGWLLKTIINFPLIEIEELINISVIAVYFDNNSFLQIAKYLTIVKTKIVLYPNVVKQSIINLENTQYSLSP
jgi:hypothetical protein